MTPSNPNPTPTIEQLIAFAAGDLPVSQRAGIEASIQRDPAAARVVNAWRAAHAIVSNDDSVAPSMAALTRAKAIFAARAVAAPSLAATLGTWINAVDHFVATLLYDSRLQPASVRFAGPHDRITMTFESDAGEIDLQAERITGEEGGRWRIMGQIADEAGSGFREIAIVDRTTRAALANGIANAHGEFSLDVPAGDHELLIRCGASAIALGPITLA